jgi:hypothetical protein
MTSSIWLSARTLLHGFGDAAAFQAALHADDCLANGDMDGARAWRMVIRAIEEMRREPEDGDRVNESRDSRPRSDAVTVERRGGIGRPQTPRTLPERPPGVAGGSNPERCIDAEGNAGRNGKACSKNARSAVDPQNHVEDWRSAGLKFSIRAGMAGLFLGKATQ